MSLSSWKLKTLSIGGRLTLLKSVLGSTPIYNMSLFKVPKAVLKSMESIRRNFFNGIRDGEKKIAWVSWSKVLASKSNGGLGVSSFYALNRGLLFKWIWRFLSRDQSLWAQVIHALHGSNTSTLSASYSSLWSSIIKECNALKSQGLDLISHCKIRVGNGMSTSFWHDQWLGDSCLRLSYPRLFALENNKVCSVAAKMSAPFVSSLRRDVRGGEESAQLSRISDLLDTVVLSNMGDRRFWDLNGDGCFRVKDVRRLLDDMLLPKSDVPSRWVKQIPIKVNVLAWKISMDRLPTRVNLHRRGVQVSPISCPICCEALENLDHLLFCCDLAKDIARSICNWWGLVWNPVDSYRSWLSWFNLVQLQSSSKQVLEGVFYTSWWSIWSYRNHLLFSDSNLRKDGIFEDIVRRSFSWGDGFFDSEGSATNPESNKDKQLTLPDVLHEVRALRKEVALVKFDDARILKLKRLLNDNFMFRNDISPNGNHNAVNQGLYGPANHPMSTCSRLDIDNAEVAGHSTCSGADILDGKVAGALIGIHKADGNNDSPNVNHNAVNKGLSCSANDLMVLAIAGMGIHKPDRQNDIPNANDNVVNQEICGSANDPMFRINSTCSSPDMDNREVAVVGIGIHKADGQNDIPNANDNAVNQGIIGLANDPMLDVLMQVACDGIRIDKADGNNDYTYSQCEPSTLDVLVQGFDSQKNHPGIDVIQHDTHVYCYVAKLNGHPTAGIGVKAVH
ncbi:RNA-directed DNA polymerase, eukaryota, partial [Tanacetum coccineum]